MAIQSIPIRQTVGDTWSIPITVQTADGTPINISGRSYAIQVRPTSDDTAPLIVEYTCVLVSGGTTGQVVCTVPATTTATLEPQQALYDVREINGSVVTRLWRGTHFIDAEVTR